MEKHSKREEKNTLEGSNAMQEKSKNMPEGSKSKPEGNDTWEENSAMQKVGKSKQGKKYISWGVISAVVLVLIVMAVAVFNKKDKFVEIPGYVVLDEENPTLDVAMKDEKIVLKSIGHYTGAYVEDGSDREMKEVLAIVVKNDGKQMIENAAIQMDFGLSGMAEFSVTKLPAGTSALVLEQNKLTYSGEPTVRYMEEKIVCTEEESDEENFEFSQGEKELTLKNKTENEYGKIGVYYKTKITDDMFLGGIAYQTVFEMVPAEGEVTQKALHFSPENSEVVFVEIKED